MSLIARRAQEGGRRLAVATEAGRYLVAMKWVISSRFETSSEGRWTAGDDD